MRIRIPAIALLTLALVLLSGCGHSAIPSQAAIGTQYGHVDLTTVTWGELVATELSGELKDVTVDRENARIVLDYKHDFDNYIVEQITYFFRSEDLEDNESGARPITTLAMFGTRRPWPRDLYAGGNKLPFVGLVDHIERRGDWLRVIGSPNGRIYMIELDRNVVGIFQDLDPAPGVVFAPFHSYEAFTARVIAGLEDADWATVFEIVELLRESKHIPPVLRKTLREHESMYASQLDVALDAARREPSPQNIETVLMANLTYIDLLQLEAPETARWARDVVGLLDHENYRAEDGSDTWSHEFVARLGLNDDKKAPDVGVFRSNLPELMRPAYANWQHHTQLAATRASWEFLAKSWKSEMLEAFDQGTLADKLDTYGRVLDAQQFGSAIMAPIFAEVAQTMHAELLDLAEAELERATTSGLKATRAGWLLITDALRRDAFSEPAPLLDAASKRASEVTTERRRQAARLLVELAGDFALSPDVGALQAQHRPYLSGESTPIYTRWGLGRLDLFAPPANGAAGLPGHRLALRIADLDEATVQSQVEREKRTYTFMKYETTKNERYEREMQIIRERREEMEEAEYNAGHGGGECTTTSTVVRNQRRVLRNPYQRSQSGTKTRGERAVSQIRGTVYTDTTSWETRTTTHCPDKKAIAASKHRAAQARDRYKRAVNMVPKETVTKRVRVNGTYEILSQNWSGAFQRTLNLSAPGGQPVDTRVQSFSVNARQYRRVVDHPKINDNKWVEQSGLAQEATAALDAELPDRFVQMSRKALEGRIDAHIKRHGAGWSKQQQDEERNWLLTFFSDPRTTELERGKVLAMGFRTPLPFEANDTTEQESSVVRQGTVKRVDVPEGISWGGSHNTLLTPGGQWLLYSGENGTTCLWSALTAELSSCTTLPWQVESVAVLSGTRYLVIVGESGGAVIDPIAGTMVQEREWPHLMYAQGISGDGTLVFLGYRAPQDHDENRDENPDESDAAKTREGAVASGHLLWDATDNSLQELEGHSEQRPDQPSGVTFSHDKRFVAFWTTPARGIDVFDLKTQQRVGTPDTHFNGRFDGAIGQVVFTGDNKWIAAHDEENNRFYLWERETGKVQEERRRYLRSRRQPKKKTFLMSSPRGDVIAYAGDKNDYAHLVVFRPMVDEPLLTHTFSHLDDFAGAIMTADGEDVVLVIRSARNGEKPNLNSIRRFSLSDPKDTSEPTIIFRELPNPAQFGHLDTPTVDGHTFVLYPTGLERVPTYLLTCNACVR